MTESGDLTQLWKSADLVFASGAFFDNTHILVVSSNQLVLLDDGE